MELLNINWKDYKVFECRDKNKWDYYFQINDNGKFWNTIYLTQDQLITLKLYSISIRFLRYKFKTLTSEELEKNKAHIEAGEWVLDDLWIEYESDLSPEEIYEYASQEQVFGNWIESIYDFFHLFVLQKLKIAIFFVFVLYIGYFIFDIKSNNPTNSSASNIDNTQSWQIMQKNPRSNRPFNAKIFSLDIRLDIINKQISKEVDFQRFLRDKVDRSIKRVRRLEDIKIDIRKMKLKYAQNK
jgi:hypothetical protein